MWERWHEEPNVVIVREHAEEKTAEGLSGVERVLVEILAKDVPWLWWPYIPLGMISIVDRRSRSREELHRAGDHCAYQPPGAQAQSI